MIKDYGNVVSRAVAAVRVEPKAEPSVSPMSLATTEINVLGTILGIPDLDTFGTPQQPRRLRWDFAGGLQQS